MIKGVATSVMADPIVRIVMILLAILFYVGWKEYIARQAIPPLMTSLGILGTFMGIFVALEPLEFTPGKINESVSALLSGMKTAFVTSLLGLLFAIVFKVSFSFKRSGKEKTSPEHQDLVGHLDGIRQAISGEGDSSLVTQMQKLRDENRDGFDNLKGLSETIRGALVENLENLIGEIRDIIGRQLGESLQGLIRSIEKALIEQFGKTFVEFNEAVQALKKWQEDHRGQVEQLTEAFDKTAQGIEKIREECAYIPQIMEKLHPVLESANKQVMDLTARLEAFAEMKQQAQESFPVIKENLDQIGENLRNSAAGFQGLEETIQSSFQQAEQQVRAIVEQHTDDIQAMAGNMRETMEKSQREVADKVDGIIAAAIERYAEQTSAELDRIAKAWGGNLVSIAERCAETVNAIDGRRRGL
ncbi:MAG: MotA/TolQ/ExbB proton channel family protein [Gammaproteobacteria bacterium]|nr:MotA/TolQ/ExbB proton channel family protein [Gammaproteobacteria bacterium]